MRNKLTISMSFVALGVASSLGAGCRPTQLEDSLGPIHMKAESAVHGLLELGQQTGICFGIEVTDQDVLLLPVAVDTKDSTVGGLIHQLLPKLRQYEVVITDAVVCIRSTESRGRQTQLDIVVPEYKINTLTMSEASVALLFRLRKLADPSIQGIGGSLRNHLPRETVLPINERDKTTRELLTALISHSRGGAWVARSCPVDELRTTSDTCWKILEYRDETDTFMKEIGEVVQDQKARFRTPGRIEPNHN